MAVKKARKANGQFKKTTSKKKKNPGRPAKKKAYGHKKKRTNPAVTKIVHVHHYKKKTPKKRNPSMKATGKAFAGATGKSIMEAVLFLGGFAAATAGVKLAAPSWTGYKAALAKGGVGIIGGGLVRLFAKKAKMKNLANYLITGGIAAGIVSAVNTLTGNKYQAYLSGLAGKEGMGTNGRLVMEDYSRYKQLPTCSTAMSDFRYTRGLALPTTRGELYPANY